MPVETATDRLAFLNTDEFACECSYTPVSGGSASTIKILFDSASAVLSVGDNASAQSRTPKAMCRVDDLTNGGVYNDQIVITEAQLEAAGLDINPAGTYKIKQIEPDGTGFVTLTMEKQ